MTVWVNINIVVDLLLIIWDKGMANNLCPLFHAVKDEWCVKYIARWTQAKAKHDDEGVF